MTMARSPLCRPLMQAHGGMLGDASYWHLALDRHAHTVLSGPAASSRTSKTLGGYNPPNRGRSACSISRPSGENRPSLRCLDMTLRYTSGVGPLRPAVSRFFLINVRETNQQIASRRQVTATAVLSRLLGNSTDRRTGGPGRDTR